MADESERAGSSGGGGERPAAEAERRQAVRETLLRFARDVAAAGSKAEVIEAITSVDGHVDVLVERLEADAD